ncbi:MFS transporter small subunit [Micromonospora sp. RP3T]
MNERSSGGQQVRLVVSWLVVAALLGYGVVQTLITAAKLFTQ